ncbi:hypothetical protein ACFL1M_03580 [Patescibacteria group bacterium]
MAGLTKQLESLIAKLFGSVPVRVIIAKDFANRARVTSTGVCLWKDPDKKERAEKLKKGNTYRFVPAGIAQPNKKGVLMMPVYWKKQILWVNPKYLKIVG